MGMYFEIIDDEGVIESPIKTLDEGLQLLEDYMGREDFETKGDVKLVEVHAIER